MTAFLSGFFLGMSLIVAIGAQNAFILKQGLKQEYVFVLCLLCALSDAILISIGVFAVGRISSILPSVLPLARYGGSLFLFVYGAKSFHRACTSSDALESSDVEYADLWSAMLVCLALTWLNPHVYLDTVVLLGSISTGYFSQRFSFACGAILASFSFFFALGYGARLLIPLFRLPSSWRVLEGCIGCMMWWFAVQLII